MKKHSLKQYFIDGFKFTNKNLDLFLILLSVSFVSMLLPLSNQFIGNLQKIASFIWLFIYFSFQLSVPVFLLQKQKEQKISYTLILNTTLANTKRIILPSLVFGVILFVLFMGFMIFTTFISPLPKETNPTYNLNFSNRMNLFINSIIILLSLFHFTSFYFSLEKKSLFSSLKKSLITTYHHPRYIGIILFIYLAHGILMSVIPIQLSNLLIIQIITTSYMGLITGYASLLYYQKILQDKR